MKITTPYDYQPFERALGKNGRFYIVGEGKNLPSVTTILSATKDTSFLTEWRERVGTTEAARITTEAANIGQSLHKNIENFILDQGPPEGTLLSKLLANLIIKQGLCNVDEVWGSEISLYAKELYAGTADLVGLHKGVPAIIDFKNSIKAKKKEWISDYFMQLTAYALCHNEMYNTNIEKGVVMIACRDGQYQEFIIEGQEFIDYQTMWANKVCEYYSRLNLE
jgi:genome maintenance exonuclease 1